MIRLLKRFADWLDKRFPPKLRYTQELNDYLRERISFHGKNLDTLRLERDTMEIEIKEIKASLAAIKDALGKSGVSMSRTESERMRDLFVKGEFGRSREEIEKSAA